MELLAGDLQRKCFELIPISEVCRLQRVSSLLRAEIRRSFESRSWDVIHRPQVDPVEHRWLNHLLEANINIRKIAMEDPVPALFGASAQNFPNVVELLLRAFPDLDVNARRVVRPWDGFLQRCFAGYQPRKFKCSAIFRAFKNGHPAVVDTLLANGAVNIAYNSRDSDPRVALHATSCRGRSSLVDVLLAAPGVDVNAAHLDDQTPLHWASRNGHVAVVDALLAAPGIDANARASFFGRNALHFACVNGREKVVSALLAAADTHEIDVGARVQFYGETPLHCACKHGHAEVVKLLLEAKYIDINDINARDRYRRTPLYYAYDKGHGDVVDLLLDVPGIDANAIDYKKSRRFQIRGIRRPRGIRRFLLCC